MTLRPYHGEDVKQLDDAVIVHQLQGLVLTEDVTGNALFRLSQENPLQRHFLPRHPVYCLEHLKTCILVSFQGTSWHHLWREACLQAFSNLDARSGAPCLAKGTSPDTFQHMVPGLGVEGSLCQADVGVVGFQGSGLRLLLAHPNDRHASLLSQNTVSMSIPGID